MRMTRRADGMFANDKVFLNRFGSRAELITALSAFCRDKPEFADVGAICETTEARLRSSAATPDDSAEVGTIGFVYLLKSGRYCKIGPSNAVGRRERELAIQLAEKSSVVHSIKTDDPAGIEDYWHRRFSVRRKNGEWFALESADVSAFKRRKFM
jgi:hypothetical protein